ncbi:MAG: accessory factor UbiK family protein [Gammaproteobacteria bacterium]|nr:accessory factor UbiK family protein [Gammaproteobacteria bacterium]
MIDPKTISEIIQNVIESMPQGLKNMPSEMQHNFRSALQGVFERLDLVTREEFDVQCKVLLRTREKLEALERKIAEPR